MTADEPADDGPDSLYRRTLLRLSAVATGWFATIGGASAGDSATVGSQQERPDITGLHAPQIDGSLYGHAGQQLPEGKAAEWADAHIESSTLIAGGGDRSLDVETYTKMVGPRLSFGVRIPSGERDGVESLSAARLSQVQMYVDRSGSGELGDGDIRVSGSPTRVDEEGSVEDPAEGIESVNWGVEVLRDGEFVPIQEVEPGQSAATMMARDTADGGLGIETSVDLETLDRLLDEDSEDQASYNINAELLSGNMSWGVNYDPTEIPRQYRFGGKYNVYDPPPLDNSSVGRVEITQSVQDASSSLPLAQNKQTLARVFVDHPESNPIDVKVSIEAKAQGVGGTSGWTSLGTRSKTTKVPAKPHSREDFDDSVNFELPASWRSKERLIIVAEVDRPGHIATRSGRSGHTYVVLGKTYDPRLFVGRVDGPNGRPSLRTRNFHVDALRRLYPIDNVRLFWFTSNLINNVSNSDNLISRLDRIARYLQTTKWSPIDQVFGLTTAYGGGLSSPSWAGGPNNHLAAWGDEMFNVGASTSMDHIMGHEIDHNIGGRKWAFHLNGPCGSSGGDSDYKSWRTGEVGWSPAYNRMIPNNHPELMSYCNSRRSGYSGPTAPYQWVSEYRWKLLYNRFRNWTSGKPKHSDFGGPSPALLADGSGAQEVTARVISGFMNRDGSGELLPSFEIPGETETPANQAEDPDAILRVHYTNQTVELGIRALFETAEGEQVEEMGFNYAFPDGGEIRAISLVDAETEERLDGYESSDFTVQEAAVEVPEEFERGEASEVAVSVQAESNVQLFRQLLYSPDGENWLPYTGAFTDDSVTVEYTDGPGGEAARFLLLVSDGVRTEQFESSTFVMPPEPPKVRIARAQKLAVTDANASITGGGSGGSENGSGGENAAGEAEAVDATIENVGGPVETVVGATVSLQAYGTTEQGAELGPEQFEWSIEGPDGEQVAAVGSLAGERIVHRFASPGVYTVEVVGTDQASGLSAVSTIDVVVSPPPLADASAVQEFLEAREAGSETDEPTPIDEPTPTDSPTPIDEPTPTEGEGPPTDEPTETDVSPTEPIDETGSPTDEPTPGFGVGSALAALGGVGYMLKRRLFDRERKED